MITYHIHATPPTGPGRHVRLRRGDIYGAGEVVDEALETLPQIDAGHLLAEMAIVRRQLPIDAVCCSVYDGELTEGTRLRPDPIPIAHALAQMLHDAGVLGITVLAVEGSLLVERGSRSATLTLPDAMSAIASDDGMSRLADSLTSDDI